MLVEEKSHSFVWSLLMKLIFVDLTIWLLPHLM